jgi:XTP/dITP diphosphohydrolase
MRILLASQNKKKRAEFEAMFEPLGVELLPPQELPDTVEDQPDFAGNARKKAREAALATGEWCLADDSGLEVFHLDGAPGVYSARFAGEHGDDAANNAKLLRELEGVGEQQRGARFVCALCLCRPDGTAAIEVFGEARGRILEVARGSRDFGYDPLFLFTEPGFPETGRGFAELEPKEKAAVSHRGRALAELLPQLAELMRA